MSVIDDVKGRLDIVDVAGEHVALKRAGRNLSGLCPFHTERTPSFIVSPERQTWHCFGACATGGDIFSFVMKREGVEFAEALRILAQRAGVTLSDWRDPEEDVQRRRLIEANGAAAAFFHHALLHSTAAAAARDYLQSRGLDPGTVEAFQLGFSPDRWDALRSHLSERGFTPQELLDAGLLVESERGGYDRFRGRLMFPISDDRGRVVGFGGRTLAVPDGPQHGGSGAKYINTPQTPLFDKGALLYALDKAKETIRREQCAIVVEGYMDVIAAHQHGITNVVASMGTALTERQIRALERLRGKILLALDADAAGMEATLRALQEAGAAGAVRAAPRSIHPDAVSEEEFSRQVQEWSRDALKRAAVNFYVVPLSGKDPDELIRRDRSAWEAAVAAAKPFTDHVFDVVAARTDLGQPAGRVELLRALLPVVRLIDEPVYRAHYVQRLARLTQIREDEVRAELRRRPRPTRKPEPLTATAAAPGRIQREPGEEFCLALLLRHPELRAKGLALSPDLFSSGAHRAIFAAWQASGRLDEIRESLLEDLRAHLDRVVERELPVLVGTQLHDALDDCVRRIELRRLSQAKQASAAALSEPEVQAFMSEAIAEAVALQAAGSGGGSDPLHSSGDRQASELAASLVQDDEMGRRLHRLTFRPEPARAVEVPPQE